jgi:hypothetical protein
VAVKYLLDRGQDRAPSRKRSAERKSAAGPTVSADTGIAAGRDLRIGGNVTVQQNRIPKAAVALVALGLLVLGYAILNSGNRVSVNNGNYVGGNVINSQVGPPRSQ